jgi:amidase
MKDDLSSYLAGRAGEGVLSLADVIAFELEHAATELAHFGHEFFTQAVATEGRAGQDYRDARARNVAWAVETCLTPALQDVDVLLAPSYGPAWKSDLTLSGHQSAVASCATMPAAVAGWPIANVPMGLVGGLPVGLAILGRAHDEWKILSAARAVEAIVTATTPLGRPAFATPTRG